MILEHEPLSQTSKRINKAVKEFLSLRKKERLTLDNRIHHVNIISCRHNVKFECVYRILYGSGGNEHAKKT